MARKKRLDTAAVLGSTVDTTEKKNTEVEGFRTAAYARLSVEDSGKTAGYSLQNQEKLLMDFIKEHEELQFYKLYTDNGVTGTKFERPGFDEMMQDMRSGKINCIVVKDLSRLGRNYLEAGNYLEQIFPFFQVRFISINDHYDSHSPDVTDEALMIPLKNIINEGYARDISIKVSTALHTRQGQGKFTGKYPPYGYLKSREEKGTLVIDPDTKGIVERIFQMRANDMPLGAIAKLLNSEGIPSPARYLWLKGISKESRFQESYWDRVNVRRLLENPVYIGNLVHGKEETSFARGIKRHRTSKTQWRVIENTHEPILSRELFDTVQKKIGESRQAFFDMTGINQEYQPENLFRGLVRCGDCGQAMIMTKFVKRGKNGGECHYSVYECSRYKRLPGLSCQSKYIRKDALDRAVTEAIHFHIDSFLDMERMIAKFNREEPVRREAAGQKTQIKTRQSRLAKIQRLSTEIYEDYREGILSETEYLTLRKQYAQEGELLKAKIDQLFMECESYDEDFHAKGRLRELAETYRDFQELNREIVESLIAEVKVHTKGRLTIVFRFEDEFRKLEETWRRREAAQ